MFSALFDKPGFTFKMQRSLSVGHALPVIGPFVVSPIKAIISLVEAIIGITGAIFLSIPGYLFGNQTLQNWTTHALDQAALGGLSFTYSMANMLSLGILGLIVENPLNL